MNIHLDIGLSQLKKSGEELCGDTIEIQHTGDSKIIVLSDGLGSGVKANILSQITAKTASTMLCKGSKIEEVIETLAHTLPMCRVRQLAYSTFTIVQVFSDGKVYLAEYDNPAVFWVHRGKVTPVPHQERIIEGKLIRESYFTAIDGDWLLIGSDGILHAGIGSIWNLGWGWDRVSQYLENTVAKERSASEWASDITRLCNHLYGGKPGDDASIVVLKIRNPRHITVLIGPPAKVEDDCKVVNRLMESPGEKIVCGGTTGNIVGRCLGTEVVVDLQSNDERIPPTGIIPGVDLVTEGTLTLIHAVELLRREPDPLLLSYKKDGAGKLVSKLIKADSIDFIIGTATNPAQKSPDYPSVFIYKQQIIRDLIQILKDKNKKITVEYH
jgi:hypothetical protein